MVAMPEEEVAEVGVEGVVTLPPVQACKSLLEEVQTVVEAEVLQMQGEGEAGAGAASKLLLNNTSRASRNMHTVRKPLQPRWLFGLWLFMFRLFRRMLLFRSPSCFLNCISCGYDIRSRHASSSSSSNSSCSTSSSDYATS